MESLLRRRFIAPLIALGLGILALDTINSAKDTNNLQSYEVSLGHPDTAIADSMVVTRTFDEKSNILTTYLDEGNGIITMSKELCIGDEFIRVEFDGSEEPVNYLQHPSEQPICADSKIDADEAKELGSITDLRNGIITDPQIIENIYVQVIPLDEHGTPNTFDDQVTPIDQPSNAQPS